MREILFRGKTLSGAWKYGYFLKSVNFDEDDIAVITDNKIPEYVLKNTIGQYTGLTANGTKIFEGDIVESRASENKEDWKYWQVIFYDGSYCFEREVKKRKYKYEQNLLCEDEVSLYGLVVVGNIHDNPELLKGVRE